MFVSRTLRYRKRRDAFFFPDFGGVDKSFGMEKIQNRARRFVNFRDWTISKKNLSKKTSKTYRKKQKKRRASQNPSYKRMVYVERVRDLNGQPQFFRSTRTLLLLCTLFAKICQSIIDKKSRSLVVALAITLTLCKNFLRTVADREKDLNTVRRLKGLAYYAAVRYAVDKRILVADYRSARESTYHADNENRSYTHIYIYISRDIYISRGAIYRRFLVIIHGVRDITRGGYGPS